MNLKYQYQYLYHLQEVGPNGFWRNHHHQMYQCVSCRESVDPKDMSSNFYGLCYNCETASQRGGGPLKECSVCGLTKRYVHMVQKNEAFYKGQCNICKNHDSQGN